MKIVTYNVNGVRSAIEKGLIEWIERYDFDLVCLQETKAHSGSVPVILIESLGYRHHWHSARRKGYSGVATVSKTEPSVVQKGIGDEAIDLEGRILRTDLGDLTVLNCYFPNGGSGAQRQAFKMRFLEVFFDWVQNLREERPNLIVVGDYNIAHRDRDTENPTDKQHTSGFLPAERQWLDEWFSSGFVDAFRQLHPNETSFTWWRATSYGRQLDKGWRIDYQSVSASIADRIKSVTHMHDAFHSDHCPVLLEIDLD
jgi:exodeoxyribonuclease-3